MKKSMLFIVLFQFETNYTTKQSHFSPFVALSRANTLTFNKWQTENITRFNTADTKPHHRAHTSHTVTQCSLLVVKKVTKPSYVTTYINLKPLPFFRDFCLHHTGPKFPWNVKICHNGEPKITLSWPLFTILFQFETNYTTKQSHFSPFVALSTANTLTINIDRLNRSLGSTLQIQNPNTVHTLQTMWLILAFLL